MSDDRCDHPSEAYPEQRCYSRKGHVRPDGTPTPHVYSDCGYCSYSYDPCPHHDPSAARLHDALCDVAGMKYRRVRVFGWLWVDVTWHDRLVHHVLAFPAYRALLRRYVLGTRPRDVPPRAKPPKRRLFPQGPDGTW